ncbi:hypothetical protein HMPREF1548_00922 [Clostridium sp. KLE 1755]|nr:hypothetical protein HMPREF1548_00922 [Clostridium sp. KLE 1755]
MYAPSGQRAHFFALKCCRRLCHDSLCRRCCSAGTFYPLPETVRPSRNRKRHKRYFLSRESVGTSAFVCVMVISFLSNWKK